MTLDLSVLIIILVILLMPYLVIGLLMFTLGRSVKLKKDFSQKPTVTIYLPTYNEEKFIEKKLDNLLEQTYPIHEILIYDCSTDKTPAIIQKKYEKKNPSIKLIRQPVRIGMARTLNQAFGDATGEIFIKTDCDALSNSRDDISELVANFGDKRVGAATGVTTAEKGIEKLLRRFLIIIQILETNIDSTIIGNSTLCAFKTSLVQPVDINSMAEDTEEMVLIRRQGHKVIADPSVMGEEAVPNEFRKRRLQKDRRAQGIIRVILRNNFLLLNPRFGLYGLIVFPLELFILAFSPFLLLGLGIILEIMLYTIHPIIALTLLGILVLAFVHRSNIIAAIIDSELSALIGTIMNLAKKDNPLWTKVR